MKFSYNTYSIDNLVAQTCSLLQSYQDNGQVDRIWLRDRITKGILPHYRTQETWIPHTCLFEVCDGEVELPCKISDIICIDLLDTDNETIKQSGFVKRDTWHKSQTRYNSDIGQSNSNSFDLFGNTIKFYSDSNNGLNVAVTFYAFMRNDCGEIEVPEDYVEPIIMAAAAEWFRVIGDWKSHGSYKEDSKDKKYFVKGESNKQSSPQQLVTDSYQQPRTYISGVCGQYGSRFTSGWVNY